MDKKKVTIFNFVDNANLASIVAAKGQACNLSDREKKEAQFTLGNSIGRITSGVQDLKGKIQYRIINILSLSDIPANILENIGDAVIFGGFPNINSAKPEFVEELKKIIRSVVNSDKLFLGICFGHQLLAKSFGGELALMDKRLIGATNITLNLTGARDSIFAQLNTNFSTISWHSRRVSRLSDDITLLGSNATGLSQVIRVGDNAWGIQGHPDFTGTGTIGLVKLGTKGIIKELNDPEMIINGLKGGFKNSSTRAVEGFLRKVVGM